MATTESEIIDEILLNEGAHVADRLYAAVEGEWRAPVVKGCAMFAALLIVEQTPGDPDTNPRELARQDMLRVQIFLDEVLKSIQALRIENPYARPH